MLRDKLSADLKRTRTGAETDGRTYPGKHLQLLADLSELLRTFGGDDPQDLLYEVATLVGEYLQVQRCLFNEIDLDKDLETVHRDYSRDEVSVAGQHKISDYSSVTSAEVAAGKTVVNYDSKFDPRTAADYERTYGPSGERAYVAVPMLRKGRWVASLWVSDTQPRRWSEEEVALLEQVAERSWFTLEKVRSEHAVRESARRLALVANTAPVFIAHCSTDLRFLFVNQAYAARFGLQPEDIIGKRVVEIMGETGFAAIRPYVEMVLQGRPVEFELEVPYPTLGRHFMHCSYAPDFGPDGQVAGWVAAVTDITARRQSERDAYFLATLGEEIRLTSDPDILLHVVCAMTAKHLGIAHCYLAEIDLLAGQVTVNHEYSTEGSLSMLGVHSLGNFPPERVAAQKAGQTMATADTATDAATAPHFEDFYRPGNRRAVFMHPLLREGVWVGSFLLNHTEPRVWEEREIELLKTVAERTWLTLEKLRIEQEQRESARQLALIADTAPIFITHCDAEQRFKFVNRANAARFGLKPSDFIGKTVLEMLGPQAYASIRKYVERVLSGQSVEFEVEVPYATVGPRYIRSSYVPEFDAEGKVVGWVAAVTDISDRRRAEEALRASEQHFASIFQLAPHALVLSSAEDYRIVQVNDAFEKMFGITAREAVGKTTVELGITFETEVRERIIRQLQEENRVRQVEYAALDRNGNLIYLSLNLDILTIGGQQFVLSSTEDITARKEFETRLERLVQERTQELQVSNLQLESSNKELEQFAFVTSHDLQEPLRKIRLFSDRLRDRSWELLDATGQHDLGKIIGASERMTTLIKDLLRFSRLSQPAEPAGPVNLDEELRQVLETHDLRIAEKGAHVEVSLLPWVEGVAWQLNLLLSNLIGNALKFSHSERAPLIRIHHRMLDPEEARQLGLKADQPYVEISVQDNGIGFQQAYAEQIFVIFRRLNNAIAYPGTGIGLSICSKVVAVHHGKIYARSTLGEGSTFYVVLPLKQ